MHTPDREFTIQGRKLGLPHPTYFIADIAANHDGDLERAKDLIYLAAEAGADAAKFQHFAADTIVSDRGFKDLGGQQSHQSKWKKSVFEVYQAAALNPDWTPILKQTCDQAKITFFTSPYSLELVDLVDPYLPAYKIGSGDITWLEIIGHMARKQKPLLLACGASSADDVYRAVNHALTFTSQVALLQCNTNYTASLENFKFIQLNVLKTLREMYPDIILGLSDHTPGHATVLGAVALGARIIEKHFTDDQGRSGPDHAFSMNPQGWREMVDRTRELEYALGTGIKKVEANEQETVVLQRRSLRLNQPLTAGTVLTRAHLIPLRPCPRDGIPPFQLDLLLGRKIKRNLDQGAHLTWSDLI